MLVLSRKVDESIQIGQHIKLTIIRVGRNNVRLGIEAPDHMNIARSELLEDLVLDDEPVAPQLPH